MRTINLVVASVLAGMLAACGGSGPSPASSVAANRAAAESIPANASAEEVAAHMRGDVSCPAKLETTPPATNAPVDDIRGVRPGLTYEEAANVVMCTNPFLVVTPDNDRGFQIKTYGQKVRQGFTARLAEPAKTGQQIMQEMRREQQARMSNAVRHDLKPGEEKWFVSTMGMPGQEQVIAVARDSWYAKGKNPTVASVIQALVKKYGQPTEIKPAEHISLQRVNYSVRWAFDPRGRLITETSPQYNQCSGFSDANIAFHLSADCGAVVQAAVISTSENADLAQSLQVGVVNQAAGYTLLTATQQGLQAADAAKRAAQVKQAAKNANATQL